MRRYPLLLLIVALFTAPALASDAERLLRQGRVIEAMDAAARAIAADPDDVEAQELAIDVFLSLGKLERAVTHARSRVKDAPTADSHYLLGRALLDVDKSRAAYDKALELDPEHARALMGLGSLDEIAGDLAAARAAYTRATDRDPSLSEAWMGLARTHLIESHRDQALEVALTGFGHTRSVDLALFVATLDPERARSVLAEALTAGGSSVSLHVALARVALLEGDARFGQQQAQQALVLDPRAVDARSTFHWSRELLAERIDTATLTRLLSPTTTGPALRKAYDRAVTQHPRSAMARLGRALIRKTGGDAGYVDELLAASRLDPDNDLVTETAGTELLQSERPADAIEPLTRTLSARPWDRDLTLALARALRQTGHVADAALLLERVASANPDHVDSQLLYAQTLIDAGRPVEAYAVIKVAMLSTQDPRLVAAFIRVAPAAGRPAEAARVLGPLADRSGSAELKAAVERLKAVGAP